MTVEAPMATTPVWPDKSEVARRGRELYEQRIRPLVEHEENIGKLLSLDIDSGDYEIGDDLIKVVRALRERRPGAVTWTEKIGYNAVYAVGGSIRRIVK